MNDAHLANPVWHALATSQAGFALRQGAVSRFPADIAPFVAFESAGRVQPDDLASLVHAGETVDFVGAEPQSWPGWEISDRERIAQMHIDREVKSPAGPAIVQLAADDTAQMMELTRLVYPGYFRERTRELGAYFGIFDQGQLVAMAGERMRIGSWQEISAVCTHPDHLGHGHAFRLVALLVNAILRRGMHPFLHVSAQNSRALALYERIGFVTRREVGLWLARRSIG